MFAGRAWDAPATAEGFDGTRSGVAPSGAGFDDSGKLVPTVGPPEEPEPATPGATFARVLAFLQRRGRDGGADECKDVTLWLLRADLGNGKVTLEFIAGHLGEPLSKIKRRSRRLRQMEEEMRQEILTAN